MYVCTYVRVLSLFMVNDSMIYGAVDNVCIVVCSQASGFPAIITVMSNWFGKGK